jgi:hypothetical protein
VSTMTILLQGLVDINNTFNHWTRPSEKERVQ